MTDYLNYSTDEIIRYSLPVMEAISTTPFEIFAMKLGYTGVYNQDTKQQAREFLKKAHPCIGIIDGIADETVFDGEGLVKVWNELTKTFSNEDVFRWIQELKLQKTVFRKRIISVAWDSIFYEWAFDANKSDDLVFDDALKQTIRFSVMQLWLEILEVQLRFPVMMKNQPLDEWDTWMINFRTGVWMSNQIQQQSKFTAWKNILRAMNASQIEIFEKWGYANMHPHDRIFSFSLIKLDENFRNHGYY